MKPYVLSYSEEVKTHKYDYRYDCVRQVNILPNGTLLISKEILDSTRFTEAVESTDPDEISLASTLFTETIEPSDPDEISMMGTIFTATIEPTDPDEFC